MNAIHVMMAVSNSTNPHIIPNARIENLARKRKLSAVTFFIFGILLIISGSLLASFEKQRFSVSFIVFGGIGIVFAFMYWISAEKILIAMRKLNAERMRQARFNAQQAGTNNLETGYYLNNSMMGLPSYEQSVLGQTDIPPVYEEAIKIQTNVNTVPDTNNLIMTVPINSISFSVSQRNTSDATIPPNLTVNERGMDPENYTSSL